MGRKIVSSRVLFNSIKSYLIVYMLVLPAFLHAVGSGKIDPASEAMTSAPELEMGMQNKSRKAIPIADNGPSDSRDILLRGHIHSFYKVY